MEMCVVEEMASAMGVDRSGVVGVGEIDSGRLAFESSLFARGNLGIGRPKCRHANLEQWRSYSKHPTSSATRHFRTSAPFAARVR